MDVNESEPLFRAAANISKQKAGRELQKAKDETWKHGGKNSRGNADDPETNGGTNTQRDSWEQPHNETGGTKPTTLTWHTRLSK